MKKTGRLKKQLTMVNVYAIVVGSTLGDGFFLLPGIAAAQAGPAVVLCYLAAAIPLIPAIFSIAELSTAMPRAGGVYYFIDRSTHPLLGAIGGLGTWLVLVLKIAFALIGIGVYTKLFFPRESIAPVAATLAVMLGVINLFGAHKTGLLQVLMVFGLLAGIGWFVATGAPYVQFHNFDGFFSMGADAFLSTSGLVYISYVGITKVASVSEEIKDPERSLPLGIFLAMATVAIVYVAGTLIIVGVVPPARLYGSLSPVAEAAGIFAGPWGVKISAAAALLAFLSIANAGILSASRYPLAMSRDQMIPPSLGALNKSGIPRRGIYVTVCLVVVVLFIFDPIKIAELASSFQLMMFSLVCLAVIVMRECRIESYDPGFSSPLYPWMQIFGIFSPFVLILEMGMMPLMFSLALIAFGTAWYFGYARKRVERVGAMYHLFERMGQHRFGGLDRELRGILSEKGLRETDPFDEVIIRASVIILSKATKFEDAVFFASESLAKRLSCQADELSQRFLEETRLGITPVTHGIALPHLRLPELKRPEMVLLQCCEGIDVDRNFIIPGMEQDHRPIHAIFFLISPRENPGQHLRILANIASHADDEHFMQKWLSASNEVALKRIFLLKEKPFLSIRLTANSDSAQLVGKYVRDLTLPEKCLIALIRRSGETLIPRGNTILLASDILTFIGDPFAMDLLQRQYGGSKRKNHDAAGP